MFGPGEVIVHRPLFIKRELEKIDSAQAQFSPRPIQPICNTTFGSVKVTFCVSARPCILLLNFRLPHWLGLSRLCDMTPTYSN